MTKKRQQEKILLSLSGEFAVASYLCLQGYVANLTLKNFPGVDIFVFNPRNKSNGAIQVKTILGGKDYFLPENINDADPPFVFVSFKTKDSLPEFFVVPAKRVAELSDWELKTWLEGHPNAKKEQPRMISLSTIREFKGQWQNLGLD